VAVSIRFILTSKNGLGNEEKASISSPDFEQQSYVTDSNGKVTATVMVNEGETKNVYVTIEKSGRDSIVDAVIEVSAAQASMTKSFELSLVSFPIEYDGCF
jgi:hypothetical protein